ncbi:MAG: 23S rRNA pseudouridine(2604) synthase RluF [Halobacteriovoraceae bacterium]|nr:23S rRNA pseudouridine(2604) synthase RluF [Halobacteriovoraceae bacterium]
MLKDESTRLNKYIAQSGICSRREADRFIENGQVKINRKKATVEDRVKPGDEVMVNGRIIEAEEAEPFVLIAFNKPEGIVSTTDSTERDNIVSYINYPTRIFPIGRLDKESRGLIFLTNDGDIVNKILRAGNNHEKEYLVTVDKPITEDFITKMGNGVPILGMMTKKCKVEQVSSHVFRIVLVQGLNRQIRRMCEHFHFQVKKLERIRIMHISLGELPLGEFRAIEGTELDKLSKLIANSSSEANPKSKTKKKHTGKTTKAPSSKKNDHRSKHKRRRR